MSTVTPPASLAEIALAVRGVLDAGVGPAPGAPSRFELRVASRLMALLQRELEQGGSALDREREGLCHLLQDSASPAPVEDLRARLCGLIAEGAAPPALIDRLWASALDRLAIDNPEYRWR